MTYLKIIWVRILISLISGGAINEILHIATGDPNRPQRYNLSLLYAIVIYFLLTAWVKKRANK